MPVEHLMSFSTFAEQRYFAYPSPETYDSIVFNGNMVAHAPDGIAAFLLEKAGRISYLVDPQTHAFQHQVSVVLNSNGELKSSIRKLADRFGPLISNNAGRRPLGPEDFSQKAARDDFTRNVVDFQCSLGQAMADSTANKYLDGTSDDYKPGRIVAPYFFLSEYDVQAWLPIMAECIVTAAEYAEKRVWVEFCVSQGLMSDAKAIEGLVNLLARDECEGALLWIDDLNENSAPVASLKSIYDFLREVRRVANKPIINLRGGYFSLLLGSRAFGELFSGVSHGPEFGESRAVVPVGGGIPISKFYVPELHTRMRYGDAVAVFGSMGWLERADAFHRNVCDCVACVEILNGNSSNFVLFGEANAKEIKRKYGMVRMEFPTSEAKERCLRHYLQRKDREFGCVRTWSASDLLADLESSIQKYTPIVGDAGVRHLENWRRILNS